MAEIAARSINPAPVSTWDLPEDVRDALRLVRKEKASRERAIEAGEIHQDDGAREHHEAAMEQFDRDRDYGREDEFGDVFG